MKWINCGQISRCTQPLNLPACRRLLFPLLHACNKGNRRRLHAGNLWISKMSQTLSRILRFSAIFVLRVNLPSFFFLWVSLTITNSFLQGLIIRKRGLKSYPRAKFLKLCFPGQPSSQGSYGARKGRRENLGTSFWSCIFFLRRRRFRT